MSDRTHHTSLDLQLQIHNKYSHKKFLMVNTELCRNPEIGPVGAMVYAALLSQFYKLTADEESPNYKNLQNNDGWFYISGSAISNLVGWNRRTVENSIKKIDGKLIAKKKVEINKTLRYMYCFLDWEGGEVRDTSGEVRDTSLRARVLYKQKNKNINTTPISKTGRVSLRKSTPGNTPQYKKNVENIEKTEKIKKQKPPNPDAVRIAKLIFNKTKEKFPKHYPNRTWESCQDSWSRTIEKVIKSLDGNFETLENALIWMWKSDHKQAAFLQDNIRGAAALLKKWQNGVCIQVLIENYEKYGLDAQDDIDAQLKCVVDKHCAKGTDDEDKAEILNELFQVQDQMDDICARLPGHLKFYWHENVAFLKVAAWMVQIDAESDQCLYDIMSKYIEFLNRKLKEGIIGTLAPWMFSNNSKWFIEFINLQYRQTGIKVVDWQRGDYE